MDSKVMDSRPSADGLSIRRRRECLNCGKRFTTYERHYESSLVVIKSDKSSEPFDRNKLLRGLMMATTKRDVPLAKLNALVDELENELREEHRTEIHSKKLGEIVLEKLRKIDDVAYIRFASVYRDFKSIAEFQAELQGM
jgi:transcriptional repressor NrdR